MPLGCTRRRNAGGMPTEIQLLAVSAPSAQCGLCGRTTASTVEGASGYSLICGALRRAQRGPGEPAWKHARQRISFVGVTNVGVQDALFRAKRRGVAMLLTNTNDESVGAVHAKCFVISELSWYGAIASRAESSSCSRYC